MRKSEHPGTCPLPEVSQERAVLSHHLVEGTPVTEQFATVMRPKFMGSSYGHQVSSYGFHEYILILRGLSRHAVWLHGVVGAFGTCSNR